MTVLLLKRSEFNPLSLLKVNISADMSDSVNMYGVHLVSKLDCLNARCWQVIVNFDLKIISSILYWLCFHKIKTNGKKC
jgi:hypothetical protein